MNVAKCERCGRNITQAKNGLWVSANDNEYCRLDGNPHHKPVPKIVVDTKKKKEKEVTDG
jgi:hypothetical protein